VVGKIRRMVQLLVTERMGRRARKFQSQFLKDNPKIALEGSKTRSARRMVWDSLWALKAARSRSIWKA